MAKDKKDDILLLIASIWVAGYVFTGILLAICDVNGLVDDKTIKTALLIYFITLPIMAVIFLAKTICDKLKNNP